MTKQEIIKEAYGIHYEEVKNFIDENGWCVQIDYSSGKEVKNHRTLNEMGFTQNDDLLDFGYFSNENKHKWRPKSLEAIENNNGWIKIESESDLPKDDEWYWVKKKTGEQIMSGYQRIVSNERWLEEMTHYQKIIKPNEPLY